MYLTNHQMLALFFALQFAALAIGAALGFLFLRRA